MRDGEWFEEIINQATVHAATLVIMAFRKTEIESLLATTLNL